MAGDDIAKGRGRNASGDPFFEAELGARVQSARVAVNMSQGALGAAIGVSFQQVQKYEKGKDRVSASRLAAIAAALGVHPGSFFPDHTPALPSGSAPAPESIATLPDLRAAQRIGERIAQLRDPVVVRRLMALVDIIVAAQGDAAPTGAAEVDDPARPSDEP